jgi:hypothetical protein
VHGSTQVIGSVVLNTNGWIQNVDPGIDVSLVLDYTEGPDQAGPHTYSATTNQDSAVTYDNVLPGHYQLQFYNQDWLVAGSANSEMFYVGTGGSPTFAPPLQLSPAR